MNRQIQSASRLISIEDMKRNWFKHEDRLIHIKPTIKSRDSLPPHPPSKKCNYAKSLEIQLENKALLKKLTDRVENRHDVSMCPSVSVTKSTRRRYYQDHKLKWENEGLYKRLRQTKPVYNRSKMSAERKKNEKYLNTISKFGYRGFKPNKTAVKFEMKNNDLKYLSKRKILMNSIDGDDEESHNGAKLSPSARLEKQNKKIQNNNKILDHFSRHKLIDIDGQDVLLKLVEGLNSIKLELKLVSDDKENRRPLELEVKINRETFQQKFKKDLEKLLNSLRYNHSSQQFYIG